MTQQPSNPVLPVPEPSVRPVHRTWLWPTIIVTAFTALITGQATYLFGTAVPGFRQTFADFKTELPAVTVLLLQFSRSGLWMLAWVVPVVVGLFTYLATRHEDNRAVRLCWVLLTMIIGLFSLMVVNSFILYALFAPMISLIQTVSGKPVGR